MPIMVRISHYGHGQAPVRVRPMYKWADGDLRGSTLFGLLFFGSYDVFERRKAAGLATIAALFMLGLMSCAPSIAQMQAAQYAIAASPPQVLLAPPTIVNKPGYLELNASVVNHAGSPILGLGQADFIADTSGGHV